MGIALAYVFALQLFLSAGLATRMAVDAGHGDFVVCSADTSSSADDTTLPAKHASHISCAICAFAAATPTLNAVATVAYDAASAAIAAPAASSAALLSAHKDPRTSRGPPTAA